MFKSERFGKYVVSFFIDLEDGAREIKVSFQGKVLKHHVDFNYNNDTNEDEMKAIAYDMIKALEKNK